jgi:raffinose/stachyose/melibiose transport system substrate-binding protein
MTKAKVISIVLVVLIAASAFAGGNRQRALAEGQVRLNVLNYMDATEANSVPDNTWFFDEFVRRNPDVVIEWENLFNEPFHDKTRVYAASGNMPDVLYVWPSGRSDYLHDQGLLKNLTPLINKDNLRSSYLPLTMDPNQQQSGYLAMIPQGITTTHAFFINMEVLTACGLQPARTYAELKAQVPVLRARGYDTVLMPLQDGWVMQSCLFSAIAGRFGGADWHTKILSGQTKFTDPDFVNALDFVRQLYADGVIAQSCLGTSYGEGPGLFANNRSAYYIDGDWRVGAFITDSSTGQALISPAKQSSSIRIGVFPEIEGARLNSSSSVILGTGWGMGASIPVGSAKEDAAWRLIKWLTGTEVSTIRTEHGGTPTPSNTNLNFAAMQLEPMQQAIGALGNQFTTATVVIDGVFDSAVYEVINDVLAEIGLSAKPPQQAAADVQRAYDNWRARR